MHYSPYKLEYFFEITSALQTVQGPAPEVARKDQRRDFLEIKYFFMCYLSNSIFNISHKKGQF